MSDSGQHWWSRVYEGVPPWDIGRPQRAFVELQERGEVKGDVLDVGCGTGENALLFASRGHLVTGVDLAPLAIEKARSKANERKIIAEFEVKDALRLHSLPKKFDAVIDSGLFHTFTDEERPVYVGETRAVLRPGGRFFMLCFSDREPEGWGGPRRVSKAEIERALSGGWRVDYIRPARFESNFHDGGGHAWLTAATKRG